MEPRSRRRLLLEGLAPIEGGVPALLSATFTLALAEDPAERFGNATAFTSSLAQALPAASARLAERSSGSPEQPSDPETDPVVAPVIIAVPNDSGPGEPVPDTTAGGWRIRPATPTPNLGDLDLWTFAAAGDAQAEPPAEVAATPRADPVLAPVFEPSRDEVAKIQAGGYFGEMSLLTGEPRSATVCAVGDVVVVEIGADLFRRMGAVHPDAIEKIGVAAMVRRAGLEKIKTATSVTVAVATATLMTRMKRFLGLS